MNLPICTYIANINQTDWYWFLGVILLVAVLNNKTTISKHTNSLCVVLLEARQVHWLVIYIRRSQSTGRLQNCPHAQLTCGRADTWMQGAGPWATASNAYSILPHQMCEDWSMSSGRKRKHNDAPSCMLVCAGTLTAGWHAADGELGQQGPLRTFTLLYCWTMCMYYLFKNQV